MFAGPGTTWRPACPSPCAGLDSDRGGEFVNHPLLRYCAAQTPPVAFTRSRPYRKNDPAPIEQKNDTNVRLGFGYERYDHPEVWPLINALCRGTLDQWLNYFLPTMKLEKKERGGRQTVRHWPACWPAPKSSQPPRHGCGRRRRP